MCQRTEENHPKQQPRSDNNSNNNNNNNNGAANFIITQHYDHDAAAAAVSSSSTEEPAESDRTSASSCELCGSDASLYCPADDAYLCSKCDVWVHGANFLASRHPRCVLCRTCRRFTARFVVGTEEKARVLKVVVKGQKNMGSRFCESGGGGCGGGGGGEEEEEDNCCGEDLRDPKMPYLFL